MLDRSLSDRVAIEAQLPMRMVLSAIRYTHLDGQPFEPDYVNIHHRNETLAGLGDLWLTARVGLPVSDTVYAAARIGFTLPLGSTVPNPFALGDNGQSHQHIQFGSGIFQPIFGANVMHHQGGWRLRAHAMAILGLYANRYGYQPGRRFIGGLGGDAQIGETMLTFGSDLAHERAEHWSGESHMEANLGRTDVLVNLGLSRPLAANLRWSLLVRVPVLQLVPHDAITYPGIVELRVDGVY